MLFIVISLEPLTIIRLICLMKQLKIENMLCLITSTVILRRTRRRNVPILYLILIEWLWVRTDSGIQFWIRIDFTRGNWIVWLQYGQCTVSKPNGYVNNRRTPNETNKIK